jgi:capsule polysaccharide modification protein KpsS
MATKFFEQGYEIPVNMEYDNITAKGIIRLDLDKQFKSASINIAEQIQTPEHIVNKLVYRMYTVYSSEFPDKKECKIFCDYPESENIEFMTELLNSFIDKVNKEYNNVLIVKKDS